MSDQQQLNSLERFRKHPGRLVLEEHGHCEVPAGCGGVVLRWRNPRTTVPLTVHCYNAGQGTWLLDGAEVSGRMDLPPGRQVAACALGQVDRSAGLIPFAAAYEPPERAAPAEVVERPLKVLSADDGSWEYSLDRPRATGRCLPSRQRLSGQPGSSTDTAPPNRHDAGGRRRVPGPLSRRGGERRRLKGDLSGRIRSPRVGLHTVKLGGRIEVCGLDAP
jgi:hypothetical protein